MTRSQSVLAWLEDKSDWLSPLVVKEVRQVVRGREFMLSFAASLVAGLAVAFFGAAEALGGSSTTGLWTFATLMGCLAFLGLAVVPLGAFSALRNERAEQTLDLITLTALSARRIVVGKLLSQVVKLAVLFAVMAPFITMSFLLGGIDFVTILVSLALLFMASVWAGALCLFLSTAFKSRAMSVLLFGAVGLMSLFGVGIGRGFLIATSRGGFFPVGFGFSVSGPSMWWVLAIVVTFWLASLINLILLAENRLSLPTEDSVTPLRIGFLVQFLLIVLWTLVYVRDPPPLPSRAAEVLAVFGSLHLAFVATFVVTEDMAIPRRVLYRIRSSSRWGWLIAAFGPGGGRGAAYVLAQMFVMYLAAALLQPVPEELRMLPAACGYICFFTGVPALALWRLMPARVTPTKLRVAVLLAVAAAVVLPDVLHYIVRQPEVLDLSYSRRHMINPFRTLANWSTVERQGWFAVPFAIGLVGLVAYAVLIRLGLRATAETVPIDPHRPAPVAGEAGRGDVLY